MSRLWCSGWCLGGEAAGRGGKKPPQEEQLGSRVKGEKGIEHCPYMFEEGNQILRKMRDPNPTNNLVNVSFAYLKVGDEAIEWIAKSLFLNARLQRLHLQHNLITGDGAAVLAKEMEANPSISELHLGYNAVCEAGVKAFGRTLEQNTNLTSLFLNRNRFEDSDCEVLCRALRGNTTLRQLDLADNGRGVGDLAAVELANSLTLNTTLRHLDIFGGTVTDFGGKSLAEMLRTNSTLEHLNLGGQRLAMKKGAPPPGVDTETKVLLDESGLAFAQAICGGKDAEASWAANVRLSTLMLVGNGYTDATAAAFATGLRNNSTLTVLNLGLNEIGVDGVGQLDKFKNDPDLRCLNTFRMKHLNIYDNPGTQDFYKDEWLRKGGKIVETDRGP